MIYVSFHTHGHVVIESRELKDDSYVLIMRNPNEGEVALYFDTLPAFERFCRAVDQEHMAAQVRADEKAGRNKETGTFTADPAYDPFVEPVTQQASA